MFVYRSILREPPRPQLALVGLGLGIFVPANNTAIMRGTADSSASLVGGLVSMARESAPRSASR
jgi:hypothetical protein